MLQNFYSFNIEGLLINKLNLIFVVELIGCHLESSEEVNSFVVGLNKCLPVTAIS